MPNSSSIMPFYIKITWFYLKKQNHTNNYEKHIIKNIMNVE